MDLKEGTVSIGTSDLTCTDFQHVIHHLLGEKATVLHHAIDCHNCKQSIYAYRYVCDQMALHVCNTQIINFRANYSTELLCTMCKLVGFQVITSFNV